MIDYILLAFTRSDLSITCFEYIKVYECEYFVKFLVHVLEIGYAEASIKVKVYN